MNNKEFRALMWENYRKNGMISHVLFLFIMLLACSILMLSLFLYDLVLIFVPFVILPCLFVCEIATISFREQSLMTFRGFFRCFKTYFSEKFGNAQCSHTHTHITQPYYLIDSYFLFNLR